MDTKGYGNIPDALFEAIIFLAQALPAMPCLNFSPCGRRSSEYAGGNSRLRPVRSGLAWIFRNVDIQSLWHPKSGKFGPKNRARYTDQPPLLCKVA